jgi:hypothetical protein
MPLGTTISNVGEYYSAHYLDTTFTKEILPSSWPPLPEFPEGPRTCTRGPFCALNILAAQNPKLPLPFQGRGPG